MQKFFGKAIRKAVKQTGRSREQLAYQLLPQFFLELIKKYLRVRVDGLSNVPKKGPAIIIANHSGFMALDALMLGHQIYQAKKRVARIIAHKLWFIRPEISVHAHKMGLVPANYENGLKILKKGEILLLFPEGEEGNFKPSRQRYRLRQFRRGYLRLALATGAPIIPATVVGAEETHITLSQVRWAKHLFGIILPVPLNVIPLPAKWYLRFFKPILVDKDPSKLEDLKAIDKMNRKIRHEMQHKLNTQVQMRKRIFF